MARENFTFFCQRWRNMALRTVKYCKSIKLLVCNRYPRTHEETYHQNNDILLKIVPRVLKAQMVLIQFAYQVLYTSLI